MGDIFNQFRDKACCDIELAFIFGKIAFIVRLVEQEPLFRRESKRMFQALKYQIAIFAAITMPAQCRQCGCMRGIIGKIKTAFQ